MVIIVELRKPNLAFWNSSHTFPLIIATREVWEENDCYRNTKLFLPIEGAYPIAKSLKIIGEAYTDAKIESLLKNPIILSDKLKKRINGSKLISADLIKRLGFNPNESPELVLDDYNDGNSKDYLINEKIGKVNSLPVNFFNDNTYSLKEMRKFGRCVRKEPRLFVRDFRS